MKRLWMVTALMLGVLPALAQSDGKVQVFSTEDMHRQFTALQAEAKAKGSSGSTLSDSPSHALKLSVRTASGGAEVHAHFDDVIFVTGGMATLITDGTVIDPKMGKDGETKGSGIKGGNLQTIITGAVAHIPAGTPHQMIIPHGATFSALVVKVREP